MNDWYALVNDLETSTSEPDEVSQARICKSVLAGTRVRRPHWKLITVAAILMLLTACGVVVVRYTDWFESLVDPAALTTSEDMLAAMGTPIRQSQTVDGVTVSLHGALYDGNTFLLSLSVEGLDDVGKYSSQVERGQSWMYYSRADFEHHRSENGQDFLSYEQMIESIGGYIGLTRQFDTERCLLLLEPWFDVKEGRELTLHLENLSVMGQTVEGPFEFTFTPVKKEVSRIYTGNVIMTAACGEPYVVTEVVITPLEIQVTICGTVSGQGEPPEITPVVEEVRLSTDTWTWSSKSGAWIHRDDGVGWVGVLTFGTLDQIIDPASVSAVRIDDTWVEMTQLVPVR